MISDIESRSTILAFFDEQSFIDRFCSPKLKTVHLMVQSSNSKLFVVILVEWFICICITNSSPHDFSNPNPPILNFLLSFRSNGSFAHASPTRCPTFEWFFSSWFQQVKFTCFASQEYFCGLNNLSYSQVQL